MAVKCIYMPEAVIEDGTIRVTGEEHHHLLVTRTESGEPVEVMDGKSRVWSGVVSAIGRRGAVVRVERERRIDPPAVELILGMALVRAASFEWALEKAVEVGVTRIVPFAAQRSNASASRSDRCQRIVIESAKQSKRYFIPRIDPVTSFETLLEVPGKSRIIFSEAGGVTLRTAVSGSPVIYLIGPEGGWTADELKLAESRGFVSVDLGDHILRSETAAVVSAALILYEMQNSPV